MAIYRTPGVYIEEMPAFPSGVVGVATAIPIFVGYTERPGSGAVEIDSLEAFATHFGGPYPGRYRLVVASASPQDLTVVASDGTAEAIVALQLLAGPTFNLHTAIQLFYANGGGICFVVSAGTYQDELQASALLTGIATSALQKGPTMLVVPDACLLSDAGYASVAQAMVNAAATSADRMAILDLPGALDPEAWTVAGLAASRDRFYAAIGPITADLSYGAAYAPALIASLLDASDFDYRNLQAAPAGALTMNNLLTTQAKTFFGDDAARFDALTSQIGAAFDANAFVTAPVRGQHTAIATAGPTQKLLVSVYRPRTFPAPTDPAAIAALNRALNVALPLFGQVLAVLAKKLNVAPPSGAMAGVWARSDTASGVWNAPANLALEDVTGTTVAIGDRDQGEYNAPLNGMAIDIIRVFTNRGTVVWGARTLDANSLDWRYIQVRRTIIYIEQSIKEALNEFAFAANDGQTWIMVTEGISSFLMNLWQQGGLTGATAKEAFNVQCGVGSTMTGQDILDGNMRVAVSVQMIRPAEFIELTFVQKMQTD